MNTDRLMTLEAMLANAEKLVEGGQALVGLSEKYYDIGSAARIAQLAVQLRVAISDEYHSGKDRR